MLAAPDPLAGWTNRSLKLFLGTNDPLVWRTWTNQILAARQLRMQGKLFAAVRAYRKLNTAIGYTFETAVEEIDAMSEAERGWLMNPLAYEVPMFNKAALPRMIQFVFEIFFPPLPINTAPSAIEDTWEHIWADRMEGISSFRPEGEPPSSRFIACLSWVSTKA